MSEQQSRVSFNQKHFRYQVLEVCHLIPNTCGVSEKKNYLSSF